MHETMQIVTFQTNREIKQILVQIEQRKAFFMDYSGIEILQAVSKFKMAPTSLDVDMHCSVLVFLCTNVNAENYVYFTKTTLLYLIYTLNMNKPYI